MQYMHASFPLKGHSDVFNIPLGLVAVPFVSSTVNTFFKCLSARAGLEDTQAEQGSCWDEAVELPWLVHVRSACVRAPWGGSTGLWSDLWWEFAVHWWRCEKWMGPPCFQVLLVGPGFVWVQNYADVLLFKIHLHTDVFVTFSSNWSLAYVS